MYNTYVCVFGVRCLFLFTYATNESFTMRDQIDWIETECMHEISIYVYKH